MAVLRVELQDGFDDDDVVCTLDGREVSRLSGVRSSLVTSLAAVAEVQAPDTGPVEVGVELPDRGLRTTITVEDPTTQRWVAVRVVDDRLTVEAHSDQPRYM